MNGLSPDSAHEYSQTVHMNNILVIETLLTPMIPDSAHGKNFQTVHMNSILAIEDLPTPQIPLRDVDIVDGNTFRELARRSVQIYENFVGLLRYKNHLCYVSNINADF